jgi:hypothetical protein
MFEKCAVEGMLPPCLTYGQWGLILLGIIIVMFIVISTVSSYITNKERDRVDPNHDHTILW